MKMNSLEALLDVLARVPEGPVRLARFAPQKYGEIVDGRTVAALGELPIRHMREFQRARRLPDALVADIRARAAARA